MSALSSYAEGVINKRSPDVILLLLFPQNKKKRLPSTTNNVVPMQVRRR